MIKNMYFIYQQSIKSHCQLYVPGLRHYGNLLSHTCNAYFCICMIPAVLVHIDYILVIILLLLIKTDQGYVLCALRTDFVYNLDERQMLRG
jgi:hypothetical protein